MSLHPETLAIHAGDVHDANASAVVQPIYLSTTFERQADGSIGPYLYTRYTNPNREAFERSLCTAEKGACAMAFASGLAASMSILQCLKSGDHVLIPDDAYFGLRTQLAEILSRFGLQYSVVDMTRPDLVRAALQSNTAMLWLESPSNPSLKISDIAALCRMAHELEILVVCDNTWATPLLQQPLALGCDIVMHSVTKYIAGHSDVLMGAVVCARDDEFSTRLRRIQQSGGAVPSPFDCYLAARGMQTLPLRVRAASESASRIATHFSTHARVESVLYPGLPQHPQHALAQQQMQLPGAMLSLLVRGDEATALRVASRTRLFTHATSLGSVESLIEHRRSVEPADSLTPGNLLRLSVGLEHVDDLIADLEQALTAAQA